MLHDFVYLESSSPIPTCRHMDHCSLSLFLGGCTACEFSNTGLQNFEQVSLSAAELFQPVGESAIHGRDRRAARRNH
jgi:hypothetical protein